MPIRTCLACAALALFSTAVLAQDAGIQGRRADLEQLESALLTVHPDPFANIDRNEWEAKLADLEERSVGLTRNQFGIELERLVALLGDAHTSVNPQQDTVLSKRRYPVELYLFEDGLYVRRAAPELEDIVGGKVVRIGNMDPGSAIAAVAPTISHENAWWIRAWAPERLVIPEVLDGLAIMDDPDSLSITVEKDGASKTAVLAPVPVTGFDVQSHGLTVDKSGWIDMQTSGEAPLWRRHPDKLMWHAWMDDEQSLYVCYRAVTSPRDGASNGEFWDGVFSEIDRRRPKRLIIDIRENSGGNGMFNRYVVQQIVRRPDIDRSDRLFVIIGRRTFSAAQQLANQFDWWTEATFVGEPSGQKVSQYGDSRRVVLENSGISVHISTLFHQAPDPRDNRAFMPPDVFAPMTSEAYREGRDTALAAVEANGDRESVMAKVLGAIQAGQYGPAQRLLAGARMDPVNRYRDFESEMNTVGYNLLAEGMIAAAVEVFRINTRVYSTSANAFDSLGEALARAGRPDEAIAAYHKALDIDPTFPPSLAALRRLEGDAGN